MLISQGLGPPEPVTHQILGVLCPEHHLRPFLGKLCEHQGGRLHETQDCAGGERRFSGIQAEETLYREDDILVIN